ncbi:MAG TPA: fumarate hydratase [Chloroflexota bacterium]|nr:fumarate hydratase [Chloroflexota bacterium]
MTTSDGTDLYQLLEDLGRQLYVEAQKDIPPDVRAAIQRALERESSPNARAVLNTMLKAISLGDERGMLVCQDTGIPIFWIDIGTRFSVDAARLTEALARGVERATLEHPLRSSIVAPLTRQNRQTSTGYRIPVMHFDFIPDAEYIDILMMPKGSGSENMSFLKMLVPAEGIDGVKKFVVDCVIESGGNPCPPTVVGVGVGGTSDLCMTLAKKATARPIGQPNPDPEIGALEEELLAAINMTGIGPQGLGGDTTALAVHIEQAWTHITLNPVAVNMQCWRGERRRARVFPDGRVEFGY